MLELRPGKYTRGGAVALCLALSFVVPAGVLSQASAQASVDPVIVDFFFEPGCSECRTVREEIVPVLEDRFEGFYLLHERDISVRSNGLLLVQHQERLGVEENAPVSMVVDGRYALVGLAAIRAEAADRIDACLGARFEAARAGPLESGPPVGRVPSEPEAGLLDRRLRSFTVPAVAGAGLVDGVNPCAISTLVFLMSLLAVSKVRGRRMLAVGIAFCAGTFVTYFVLGFGLLRALRLSRAFPVFGVAVDVVMTAILAVLAWLSFRDAYRYRRFGRGSELTLRMPAAVQRRLHVLMRATLGARSLALAGLLIGVLVTGLESVCTGQVYVPTLVLIIKTGNSIAHAVGLLVLYNAMFLVPVLVVFVLTYQGLKTERLLRWSRRNVFVSKILLGLLFAALAGLILAV